MIKFLHKEDQKYKKNLTLSPCCWALADLAAVR
jgi:hypothetical protein